VRLVGAAQTVSGQVYNPPADTGLDIIHCDHDLLVVNKPSGLLSVPGKGPELADCLEARAQAVFPGALIVHRLDRDTSGVFVMAMNSGAQRHLGLQFERRHLAKSYQAIVSGHVAPDAGEIDLPLIADWPNRPLQKVCHDTGKPALTRWRVISRTEKSTRLQLSPHTGRSHQLRVHLKELGHPILGDPLYGDATSAPRLLLHAHTLVVHQPTGGQRTEFRAELPF